MNAEKFDRKVFERIERLQLARRQYKEAVRELQEMARKLTTLGGLLEHDPTKIRMSSDRESVEFSDKTDDYEIGISRAALDALPDQIGGTLLASRDLDQLEKCLIDAGFGDIINKPDKAPNC